MSLKHRKLQRLDSRDKTNSTGEKDTNFRPYLPYQFRKKTGSKGKLGLLSRLSSRITAATLVLDSLKLLIVSTMSRIDSLTEVSDYTMKNYEINLVKYFQLTAVFWQFISIQGRYDPPIVNENFFKAEVGRLKNLTTYLDLYLFDFVSKKEFLEGNICENIGPLPQEILALCFKDTHRLQIMNRNIVYSSIVFDLRSVKKLKPENQITDFIKEECFQSESLIFYLEKFDKPFLESLLSTCRDHSDQVTSLTWQIDFLTISLSSVAALFYIIYSYNRQRRQLFHLRSVVLMLPEELLSMNPYIHTLILPKA